MKNLLDPSFKYTPSFDTDIRKRFEKVKREIREQQKRAEEIAKEADRVVTRIKRSA